MFLKLTFALFLASLALCAQWLDYPDPRTPRTKDGKPNLTAPPPRINGKPDLSGVWHAEHSPASEFDAVLGPGFTQIEIDYNLINKHLLNVFWGLKPGEEPFTPEGAALMKARSERKGPPRFCLPGGVPISMFALPFKIIQTPQQIVMLPEGELARQIYLDGRGLPRDPQPSWTGYSVGRWDRDTLVVDTIGFTDRSPLDAFGHPRSESMRITERLRRRDFGHIDVEITFNDPKYYTRPFSLKTGLNLLPDTDILEAVCTENERDAEHMR